MIDEPIPRTLKDAVCAVIYTEDGRILTTTRRNTEELSLPGGKIDPGETTQQAIVREVKEETGIDLKEFFLRPIYSNIIMGKDRRDYYCTTFVYMLPKPVEITPKIWEVEKGIKVRYATWEELVDSPAFQSYNIDVWKAFENWQISVGLVDE